MLNPKCASYIYTFLSILAPFVHSLPANEMSNILARAGCPAGLSGPNYQILVVGDTCQTLAEKFNTSTLDIANINFAGPNCTNNFTPGFQICIPPPCNAYTVQANETCQTIADGKKVVGGLAGFYGYNPGLNDPSCHNLTPGSNVCLSAPEGENHPNPVVTSAGPAMA